jgi:hypothetical protein
VSVHFEFYLLWIPNDKEFAIHSKVNVLVGVQILSELNSVRALCLTELRHSEEGEVDCI